MKHIKVMDELVPILLSMLLLVTEGDVSLKNVAATLLEACFQMSDVAVEQARG